MNAIDEILLNLWMRIPFYYWRDYRFFCYDLFHYGIISNNSIIANDVRITYFKEYGDKSEYEISFEDWKLLRHRILYFQLNEDIYLKCQKKEYVTSLL